MSTEFGDGRIPGSRKLHRCRSVGEGALQWRKRKGYSSKMEKRAQGKKGGKKGSSKGATKGKGKNKGSRPPGLRAVLPLWGVGPPPEVLPTEGVVPGAPPEREGLGKPNLVHTRTHISYCESIYVCPVGLHVEPGGQEDSGDDQVYPAAADPARARLGLCLPLSRRPYILVSPAPSTLGVG